MSRTAIPALAAPFVFVLLPAFALAQDAPSLSTDVSSVDLPSAAEEAASALTDAAQDKLLIKDLMGSTVNGPAGDAIGTVENLVAIPGGRIVAAVLSVREGDRLVVPFSVLKLSGLRDKTGLASPIGVSELRNDPAVQSLADAVGSEATQ